MVHQKSAHTEDINMQIERFRLVTSETPIQVLIVDGDDDEQSLVDTLLRRAGMVSIPAFKAQEAAKVLQSQMLPQAIVLDTTLSDVNGIEFLKQMRTREKYNAIPVIILFEEIDPDAIREGLQAGADRYLTKPYLANNLVRTLQEVLAKGRKQS